MDINTIMSILNQIGISISSKTIRNYEQWSIIPQKTKIWHGRGKGSEVHYSEDTPMQIAANMKLLSTRSVSIERLQVVRKYGLLMQEAGLYDHKTAFEEYWTRLKQEVFIDRSEIEILELYYHVKLWQGIYNDYKIQLAKKQEHETVSTVFFEKGKTK